MATWRWLVRFARRGQEAMRSAPKGQAIMRRARLHCETLEGRWLPSAALGTITEFNLPTAAAVPLVITSGPDGALWFSEYQATKIGRITTGGSLSEFAVPTAASLPAAIITGPDGNLWFTEYGAAKVARITTAGVITEFALPTPNSNPADIKVGPDGALWFPEYGAAKIGRITTAGAITEYPVPTASSEPLGLTVGPDGALWFTELAVGKIGRITTAGAVTEFSVGGSNSHPGGITTGPDGNLWFSDFGANVVGRMTTAGAVTTYAIPTFNSNLFATITVGGDGNLWFAEYDGNKIAQVTLAGQITEYSMPTAASEPFGLTSGPDGNLWFTEYDGNHVGSFLLPLTATGSTLALKEGSGAKTQVASFRSTDSSALLSDFTAQITWGDGTTSSGSVTQPGGVGTPFAVSGRHQYTVESNYAVTVTVHDNANKLTATAYSTAQVTDATLQGQTVNVSATAGVAFTGAVATFRDNNSFGTTSDFNASITWGDGHTSAGTIAHNADGSFSVIGTNTYANAGTFRITVTITDVGGSQVTVRSKATVTSSVPWDSGFGLPPADDFWINEGVGKNKHFH